MKPKSETEIRDMRESGRILATILQLVARQAVPGVTTAELGRIAADELEKRGVKGPFLNYRTGRGIPPFPSVICISVNDEVVHGIPSLRKLAEGDIVGLDFGVEYNGMITDSAITVGVGRISPQAKRLLAATEQALYAGIEKVRDRARIGDISAAIEARLDQDKLGIVEELAGHGVGHQLHEEPWIPNFGKAGHGSKLKAGMTIAIEPMASLGKKDVLWHPDGWTISMLDGSLAAHFEHTVLVTEDGYEILTKI